jgi:hypothetical protein
MSADKAVAALYARAAASGGMSQGSLAASAAAAPNAAFLNSMFAEEQRKQAFLASQLSALGPDRLNALIMHRRALEQQSLAASLQASSLDSLGLGIGMNGMFSRGFPGAAAAQHALLLGQPGGFPGLAADHSLSLPTERNGRKGRTGTFPQKLHQMLSDLQNEEGGIEIASFLHHGRAFAIHKPKEFVKKVMSKYFRMSRFSSFQRQLNLYEFQRITEGPDKGAYYHELFVQGRPLLCTQIKRHKIKGVSPSNSVARSGVSYMNHPGVVGPTGVPRLQDGNPGAAHFLGSFGRRSL